jgi:hypothetical protein
MTENLAIRGKLFFHPSGVRGHAYDAHDLTRRLAVELVIDGWVSNLARADAFAPEAAEVGDGCYGFGFTVPERLLDQGGIVEVRLANNGEPIGGPLNISPATRPPEALAGCVFWKGGLRLSGWIPLASDEGAGVRAVVERRVVADVTATGWTSVPQGAIHTTMAAFDFHLPPAYADGCVHYVTVLDRMGRSLAGSPCPVLAYPDGLRSFLLRHGEVEPGDRRAELIEKLVPQSVPFTELSTWEAHYPAPPLSRQPKLETVAVALFGSNVAVSIESLKDQLAVRWVALQLPELDEPGTFTPADLLAFLAREPDAAVVVLALAGTQFRPEALARLAVASAEAQAIVYADMIHERDGNRQPLLWPAYDAERQLEQGYAALSFAAPMAAVAEALRRGAASLFDLLLTLVAQGEAGGRPPIHLPEILALLPRLDPRLGLVLARTSAAHAAAPAAPMPPDPETGLPSVRIMRRSRDADLAVVVVQPEAVAPDLEPVGDRLASAVHHRVVVSHHALSLPRGWRNIVVAGWRNPSRLRNTALAALQSGRLLLLDAGVEPLDTAAAAEMAGRMSAADVAAVSGVLMTPDGMILAAGAVLGTAFAVAPAFHGARDGEPGYAAALRVARRCGALDAMCLMVDRAAAAAAGGFNALHFPELYSGIDLSLKLRAAGRHLVVTPHARFVRRSVWREPPVAAQEAELTHLRRCWGEELISDPFYHPALNLDAVPYTALAWPSPSRNPRRPKRPRARLSEAEVK